MRLESIKQYWREAIELTADLPNEEFSTPDVVTYVNKYLPSGYELMTKTKVNYLRVQEILRPHGDGDIRTSWRYTRDDIRRALVVELLKGREKFGVKEIKGWLKSFEEAEAQGVLTIPKENTGVPEIRGLPDRISLATTLLRNRVLGMFITILCDGKADITPPGCFIAIRTLEHSDVPSRSNKELSWYEVEQLMKAYSWLLAFSEPHSNKIYLHPNLEDLRDHRLEIEEKLDEYIWYNVILRSTDDQHYEVVIGLKDTDSPANKAIDKTLTQHMEEEKARPIQLVDFPGLSLLLKTVFVKAPPTAQKATTLSAMAEIIANASESWDYSTVFLPVPSVDGTEKQLYVQDRSLKSPLKDRYVKVGEYLPGWCYRYHQSFVVKRAIENDPRIPFFDDGQTVAAIAVPAITEEQQSVGVVYVAKSRRVGNEDEVGFSQEVLAGLKAFGYICGDIIARDRIEIETVSSLSRLPSHPDSSPISFLTLKDLLRGVIDEVQKEISPVNALHSWIYLLTLNIEVPSDDLLTEWLCEQAVNVAGNFLAHYLKNSPQHDLLPIGVCEVGAKQYVFAVLHAVDLPEERYKQASMDLQQELSRMHIGRLATNFYSWAITFRCKDLNPQLSRKETLLDDMVDRTLGALVAGPFIKRGHDALHKHDLDQAVSQFEDALRVMRYAPTSWYVYKHLAEARMLQGAEKIDQAIAMCYEALKLNPDYASAHCLLADCLSYTGKFCEALKEYEKTLQLDSSRRRFLTHYGLSLAGMTVSEYQTAIEQLKLQEPDLIRQRFYYDTPWEEAIDKFNRVQELSIMYSDTPEEQRKHRADYHYQRGYAYLQAGQLDKAVEDFAVGRKLTPENLQLLQAYSYALSLQRRQGNKAEPAEWAISN